MEGFAKTFNDLIVWQKGHRLVLKIYKVTKLFPPEEKFGLTSQMRRAAISVPANIVEGFARSKIKERLRFYNISNASLEELKYHMLLAHDLGIVNNQIYNELSELAQEVGRLLQGWINGQKLKK